MSIEITKDDFQKLVLDSNEAVFVDFYATWCGPCRMLSPIMDEISNSFTVYKVNTDNEPELARNYGIMSIPCVILFKSGKEISRIIGLKSKEEILQILNRC